MLHYDWLRAGGLLISSAVQINERALLIFSVKEYNNRVVVGSAGAIKDLKTSLAV